jgi:hypothetical protein
MSNNINTLFNPDNASYENNLSCFFGDECTEIDEITEGKDVNQLWKEFHFQTEKMGESAGGTICSAIVAKIKLLQSKVA